MGIEVKRTTTFNESGGTFTIEESVNINSYQVPTVYRYVIDTREKSIRDGLIELGWTPPTKQKEG